MADHEQTVAFTLEIPIELFEELKRIGVQDVRPMKQELVVLLQEAVDARTRNT